MPSPIRLLSLALLSLAPFALAANKDRWVAAAAKSKDGVIALDTAAYDEMMAEPRDYSVSVVLTAMPSEFQCGPCHQYDPNFHKVSASWKRLPKAKSQDHFFAQLDFSHGKEVYQRLGLQTAPTLQFWPANAGPLASKAQMITIDFNRHGFSVEGTHEWLLQLLPHPFDIYVPFNPIPFIVLPAVLILTLVTLFFSYPYLLPIFQSKNVWAALSLGAILIFTSGYMWNRIKGAPFSQGGSLVAGGFQNQFAAETQIVAVIYGTLATSCVLLSTYIPQMQSPSKQRIAIYAWTLMLVVFFGLLIRLFKLKSPGYPFFLLG